MEKRLLPQSIEAEKIVLGLMSTSTQHLTLGVNKIHTDHFFHKKTHRYIFNALYSLAQKNKKPSLLTLREELKLQGALEVVGGAIIEIVENPLDAEDFEEALAIVSDKYSKRKVLELARDLTSLSYKDTLEGPVFIKTVRDQFYNKLDAANDSAEIVSSGDIWEKRRGNLKAQSGGQIIKIGYNNLDDLVTGGFMRKQVSVTAGRPGMGKSAFKSNLILNQLIDKRRVVSFAPEQGFDVEQARIETLMTDIPLKEILESYKWKKGDYRINKIIEANKRIDQEFNYHIVPTRGLSSKDVRPILYEISQKYGQVDTIFIDLFDKFIDVNTTDNTVNAIAVGLSNMAQYAEEFNTHINLLVQISRKTEERGDKRPKIRFLKNSGAYEEVARLILLLYREKYYVPDTLNNTVEVEVAKQSNGPLDTVFFDMDEDILSFTEKDELLGGLL